MVSSSSFANFNPLNADRVLANHRVRYFAFGNSSRCFSYIRDWVEKKIRSHLARACQRRGFGWKRWSKEWLYETLGLYNEYRVSHSSKAASIGYV